MLARTVRRNPLAIMLFSMIAVYVASVSSTLAVSFTTLPTVYAAVIGTQAILFLIYLPINHYLVYDDSERRDVYLMLAAAIISLPLNFGFMSAIYLSPSEPFVKRLVISLFSALFTPLFSATALFCGSCFKYICCATDGYIDNLIRLHYSRKLIKAARANKQSKALAAVFARADPNYKNGEAIWWAIVHNQQDLLASLQVHGGNLESVMLRNCPEGRTALFWAIKHANLPLIKKLLQIAFVPNQQCCALFPRVDFTNYAEHKLELFELAVIFKDRARAKQYMEQLVPVYQTFPSLHVDSINFRNGIANEIFAELLSDVANFSVNHFSSLDFYTLKNILDYSGPLALESSYELSILPEPHVQTRDIRRHLDNLLFYNLLNHLRQNSSLYRVFEKDADQKLFSQHFIPAYRTFSRLSFTRERREQLYAKARTEDFTPLWRSSPQSEPLKTRIFRQALTI